GSLAASPQRRKRIALVGTGIRGSTFWGRNLQEQFGDVIEFAALCDLNPGRLAFAKQFIGADCPTYTHVDAMFEGAGKLDMVLVMTDDASHDEIIIKSLERNIDVITEKP